MCRAVQRFNLASTTSFAGLDPHWKAQLVRLHDEYLESRQVKHHSIPPSTANDLLFPCGASSHSYSGSLRRCAGACWSAVKSQGDQGAGNDADLLRSWTCGGTTRTRRCLC